MEEEECVWLVCDRRLYKLNDKQTNEAKKERKKKKEEMEEELVCG